MCFNRVERKGMRIRLYLNMCEVTSEKSKQITLDTDFI